MPESPEYRVVTLPGNKGFAIARKISPADRVASALLGEYAPQMPLVNPGPLRINEALKIADRLNKEHAQGT